MLVLRYAHKDRVASGTGSGANELPCDTIVVRYIPVVILDFKLGSYTVLSVFTIKAVLAILTVGTILTVEAISAVLTVGTILSVLASCGDLVAVVVE